jgi:hypothetical protein
MSPVFKPIAVVLVGLAILCGAALAIAVPLGFFL